MVPWFSLRLPPLTSSIRRAMPYPCSGSIASIVFRTIRSSVPCKTSSLFSPTYRASNLLLPIRLDPIYLCPENSGLIVLIRITQSHLAHPPSPVVFLHVQWAGICRLSTETSRKQGTRNLPFSPSRKRQPLIPHPYVQMLLAHFDHRLHLPRILMAPGGKITPINTHITATTYAYLRIYPPKSPSLSTHKRPNANWILSNQIERAPLPATRRSSDRSSNWSSNWPSNWSSNWSSNSSTASVPHPDGSGP